MEPLHHPLETLFTRPEPETFVPTIWGMKRHGITSERGLEVLIDQFIDQPDALCGFLRVAAGGANNVQLSVDGAYKVTVCAAGGWLLIPAEGERPTYWLPQPPLLRTYDDHGHILQERTVSLAGLDVSNQGMAIALDIPADWSLDWVIWRFEPGMTAWHEMQEAPLTLERQGYFLWGSKVNVHLPAGLYHFLIHGRVYTDDFVWPRRWKFLSELDALGLYNALTGLELATSKPLYGLLKRQVLYSVLEAQQKDGGWHHGEWTDLMEVHLRLHNAAMLLLEAGFEESGDAAIREALARGAAFLAQYTDRTDIGVWFLHDSLESTPEYMEIMRQQTNTPWIPSRTLGKSPCTKLILNTHLDAIVVLDRYRALTGDTRYDDLVSSALAAARAILSLRPAESVYRLLYKAVALTLLPKERALSLPLPMRALKRLTWMYLLPNMHRFKRHWPRLVMPGGLIERHIAPMHYDINYHPVNVMDIVRTWRRSPSEDFSRLVDNALQAVDKLDLLQYWSEANNRQFAIATWTEAIYHLCMLKTDFAYRRRLAKSMLHTLRAGLGLPPALLGCDAELARRVDQHPCPSPAHSNLAVANLAHGASWEVLLVNPGNKDLELGSGDMSSEDIDWLDETGSPLGRGPRGITIPAGGWLLGKRGGAHPTQPVIA